MARSKVEAQSPATGNALLAMVGLGVAFLLFLAFLQFLTR